MAIRREADDAIYYDRYPWFVRGTLTAVFLVASMLMILNQAQFALGTAMIPLAIGAFTWMLEWRISFHPRTRQVRLRRGLRELTKETVLTFDDIEAIMIDYVPPESRNRESFAVAVMFKFDGLQPFKLATFGALQEAVQSASSLHDLTAIPVGESKALGSRRKAFDDVGMLIKDSSKNP